MKELRWYGKGQKYNLFDADKDYTSLEVSSADARDMALSQGGEAVVMADLEGEGQYEKTHLTEHNRWLFVRRAHARDSTRRGEPIKILALK